MSSVNSLLSFNHLPHKLICFKQSEEIIEFSPRDMKQDQKCLPISLCMENDGHMNPRASLCEGLSLRFLPILKTVFHSEDYVLQFWLEILVGKRHHHPKFFKYSISDGTVANLFFS